MAITGPSSYLPTTNEFIAHWMAANKGGEGYIRLRGNIGVNNLSSLRDKLEQQQAVLTQKLNEREFARGDINAGSRALVERLDQFNGRVRVLYDAGSRYVNALPKVPSLSSAAEKILTPLEDCASIWGRIDVAGQPVQLAGKYGLAHYREELDALKAAYRAYTTAVTEERIARGARNETQAKIYPILKQYREIIPTFFPEESNLVATLPRLTPRPGATPDAVAASASWDAALEKARLTWDSSDNPNLKEYEVRYSPGDRYVEDDASVIGNIAPEAPREFLTDAGLSQPGASSSFKVFVILTTGNEAGSDSLTLARPFGGAG